MKHIFEEYGGMVLSSVALVGIILIISQVLLGSDGLSKLLLYWGSGGI